jgi:hypothetical protein
MYRQLRFGSIVARFAGGSMAGGRKVATRRTGEARTTAPDAGEEDGIDPAFHRAILKIALELKKPSARSYDDIVAATIRTMRLDAAAFRRVLMGIAHQVDKNLRNAGEVTPDLGEHRRKDQVDRLLLVIDLALGRTDDLIHNFSQLYRLEIEAEAPCFDLGIVVQIGDQRGHALGVGADGVEEVRLHLIDRADRAAGPSIAEVKDWVQPAICGGVDNLSTLPNGTPDACRAEVRDARRQAAGRPIIIAPGCTYDPRLVPPQNLRAVCDAARQSDGADRG